MKNNAIIAMVTLLTVGAAVVFAQLITANGNGREPSTDLSASNHATQSPTTQLGQKDVSLQAPDPAARINQIFGKKLADAAPQQDTIVVAGADKTTTPAPKSEGSATLEQPGNAEPEIILAQNSEASATDPADGLAEVTANEQLIVSDAPPMDPRLYEVARWHPIHFKPDIDTATNEQCLVCHSEILIRTVRETSPAGIETAKSLAWYQTLDTYAGDQVTFHQRHLTEPFAQKVMNLKCNFCHQGHDPREEAPGSSATAPRPQSDAFTLRKVVNPSKTCLQCHGRFPFEVMEGLESPWHQMRADLEDPEDPDLRNGCLTCHDPEFGFRSVRHQVSYLKAEEIERLAKEGSSDVCYGCHGGRAWYRNSYPYPRHAWPDMSEEIPDWAKDRPTQSDPRYAMEKVSKETLK